MGLILKKASGQGDPAGVPVDEPAPKTSKPHPFVINVNEYEAGDLVQDESGAVHLVQENQSGFFFLIPLAMAGAKAVGKARARKAARLAAKNGQAVPPATPAPAAKPPVKGKVVAAPGLAKKVTRG